MAWADILQSYAHLATGVSHHLDVLTIHLTFLCRSAWTGTFPVEGPTNLGELWQMRAPVLTLDRIFQRHLRLLISVHACSSQRQIQSHFRLG